MSEIFIDDDPFESGPEVAKADSVRICHKHSSDRGSGRWTIRGLPYRFFTIAFDNSFQSVNEARQFCEKNRLHFTLSARAEMTIR